MRARTAIKSFAFIPLVAAMGCATPPVDDIASLSQTAASKAAVLWRARDLHTDCQDCSTPTPKTMARATFIPLVEVAKAIPQNPLPLQAIPVALPDVIKLSTSVASSASTQITTAAFSFKTGNAQAPKVQAARLATLLQAARANPKAQIVVTGFADATGSVEGNERLGVRRALFVRKLLTRKGINAQRITVKSAPLDYATANSNAEERAMNRRATVQLIGATN
jgi:outer membrane protein OmpA-like peptidoglycan-associated protein